MRRDIAILENISFSSRLALARSLAHFVSPFAVCVFFFFFVFDFRESVVAAATATADSSSSVVYTH